MRLTRNKREILELMHDDPDIVENEIGRFPLTAFDIANHFNRDYKATRRTLEAMVRDGLLVRETNPEGYYSLRFHEYIRRECVGYDLPPDVRPIRVYKEKTYNFEEAAKNFALAFVG